MTKRKRCSVALCVVMAAMHGDMDRAEAGPAQVSGVQMIFAVPGHKAEGEVELRALVHDDRQDRWLAGSMERVRLNGGHLLLVGEPGRRYVLVIRTRESDGYWWHGPFYWPSHPGAGWISSVAVGSVRVASSAAATTGARWISWRDDIGIEPSPICASVTPEEIECFGIPVGEAGVVLIGESPPVRFAVIDRRATARSETFASETAVWARLVRVRLSTGETTNAGPFQISAGHREEAGGIMRAAFSAYRPAADLTVRPLSDRAFWVSGAEPSPEHVLKIEGGEVAAQRVRLIECCLGSPEAPVDVELQASPALWLHVVNENRAPVGGAFVAIFDLSAEAEDGQESGAAPARRVREVAAECWTGEGGACRVRLLPERRYEVLAVHASRGRARLVLDTTEGAVELRLARPKQVRGRVFRQGSPAAGLPVRLAPDPVAARQIDPFWLVSVGTMTDADGRFLAEVPPEGRFDLLVGEPGAAQVRLPLPPVAALPRLTDIGDVDLPGSLRIRVRLPAPLTCELVTVGPLGRTGLTVVAAARTDDAFGLALPEPGRWLLGLTCDGRTLALDPQVIVVEHVAFEQQFDATVQPP